MDPMLSRKAEDYLEAIYLVSSEKGYARPKDIVTRMHVKYPSATEMFRKLSDQKLITYQKYGEIKLTSQGQDIAKKIKSRHDIFEQFLKIINVHEGVAKEDACILEHHLNPQTVKQLSSFVSFVKSFKNKPDFFKDFEEYCNRKRS